MNHLQRRLLGRHGIKASMDEIVEMNKQILRDESVYLGTTHEDNAERDHAEIHAVTCRQQTVYCIARHYNDGLFISSFITAGMVLENTDLAYHQLKSLINE